MNSQKTLAVIQDANVFDVDPLSGFMPPIEPLSQLPTEWGAWEAILDDATSSKIQLGDKLGLTEGEKEISEAWRARVRKLPLLDTLGLEVSPILLRRAHLVLTYIMHFYVQSLPPDAPVLIPRSISLPVLRVSARLDIPPLLTYSDTVLYNWTYRYPSQTNVPAIENLRSKTMFSGLIDEEEFYLCSARIELRGVEALEIMRMTMDEIFIGDQTAVRRITGYLETLATVTKDLNVLLMGVQKYCRPDTYYNEVRPWFRGEDSDLAGRKWIFEGLEDDPRIQKPTELSGPSAGQSSMVHVLDVFLGVDHQSTSPGKRPFMSRMQSYMPRSHRLFLDHLSSNPRPLRAFVLSAGDAALQEAFNQAVLALKAFRDSHMIIVALYILGPARRVASQVSEQKEPLKGTGGTNLVKFLKETKNRTIETTIP